MNPFADRFADRLEPVGVAVGLFLILMAIGTMLGMPWQVKDVAAAAVQIVGALGTGAVGVLLAYLSWTGRDRA